jgi:putative tricarboxylic transport membrane protein
MGSSSRIWELVVAALAIGLGVAAWVLSAGFPRTDDGYPGPALFPRLIGACLLLAGGGILFGNVRKGLAGLVEPGEVGEFGRVAGLLLALAFAPWLFSKLGLLLTVAVFVILACLLLKARPLEALLTAGIMLVFVYVIFVRLLQVGA